MVFKDTTATKKIFNLTKKIRAVAGGTSASKTISILIWLIDYAQSTTNELISVVSQSFPHLSGGAMLDFENIMKGHGYWQDKRWIRSPRPTYTFETGTKIEFLSVDDYSKAHGPRRDILFLNECNAIEYNINSCCVLAFSNDCLAHHLSSAKSKEFNCVFLKAIASFFKSCICPSVNTCPLCVHLPFICLRTSSSVIVRNVSFTMN